MASPDVVAALNANSLTLGIASSANSVPTVASLPTALTDHSDTITAAGTSQQLVAANAAGFTLVMQNPSTAALQGIAAAESLFVNFTDDASDDGDSLELLPGATLEINTVEKVTVVAATISHAFVAKTRGL